MRLEVGYLYVHLLLEYLTQVLIASNKLDDKLQNAASSSFGTALQSRASCVE